MEIIIEFENEKKKEKKDKYGGEWISNPQSDEVESKHYKIRNWLFIQITLFIIRSINFIENMRGGE
jgi:hypothetical protein